MCTLFLFDAFRTLAKEQQKSIFWNGMSKLVRPLNNLRPFAKFRVTKQQRISLLPWMVSSRSFATQRMILPPWESRWCTSTLLKKPLQMKKFRSPRKMCLLFPPQQQMIVHLAFYDLG